MIPQAPYECTWGTRSMRSKRVKGKAIDILRRNLTEVIRFLQLVHGIPLESILRHYCTIALGRRSWRCLHRLHSSTRSKDCLVSNSQCFLHGSDTSQTFSCSTAVCNGVIGRKSTMINIQRPRIPIKVSMSLRIDCGRSV